MARQVGDKDATRRKTGRLHGYFGQDPVIIKILGDTPTPEEKILFRTEVVV